MRMILALLCLTALSGIGTVTLARYVSAEGSGWLPIKPERFYFTSNILKTEGSTTQLYHWRTDQDYIFFMDIRNWEDDFRINQEDISYTVKTEGAEGIISEVKGEGQNTDGAYVIAGGLARTQKLVVTIPAGRAPAGDQITVTVKAKPAEGRGYTKTLTGVFHLNRGTEACRAEAEVHNAYIDLLIGVDKGQELKVEWPSWLTPDNTNPWLTEAAASPHSVTLGDEASCRLRFFVIEKEQSGEHFTVTEGSGTGDAHQVPITIQ